MLTTDEARAEQHAAARDQVSRQLTGAADPSDAELSAAHDWQRDQVLADANTMGDWIGAECMQSPPAHHGYVPSDDVARERYIASLTVPQLLTLIVSQPWHAHQAAGLLQAKYLAYREVPQ